MLSTINIRDILFSLTTSLIILFVVIELKITHLNYSLDSIILNLAIFTLSLPLYLILKKLISNSNESRKSEQIERDLPDFLNNMHIYLSLNLSFEESLKKSIPSRKGLLNQELNFVINKLKNQSVSVEQSLSNILKKYNSGFLRQSISHLINIYYTSYKDESLKVLSVQITKFQQIKAKQFNNKFVMYSLLFISFSSIIPAFFQLFVLLGSFFIDISFTSFEILIVITIFFPLANLILLFYIKSQIPMFLS